MNQQQRFLLHAAVGAACAYIGYRFRQLRLQQLDEVIDATTMTDGQGAPDPIGIRKVQQLAALRDDFRDKTRMLPLAGAGVGVIGYYVTGKGKRA